MVKLVVGEEGNIFHVHEDLICNASPVFNAAFNSSFRETDERSMKMPDEKADDVEHFIYWLYYRPLQTPCKRHSHIKKTLRLYVLAEKYDVAALRMETCQRLYSVPPNADPMAPPIDAVVHVFENTTEKSPMRELLADWYAWHVEPSWFLTEASREMFRQYPELAEQVIVAFSKAAKQKGEKSIKSPFDLGTPNYYICASTPTA